MDVYKNIVENLGNKASFYLDHVCEKITKDELQTPSKNSFEILKNAMRNVNYKKIFILDKLPLVNDYARLESENDQNQIHNLITEVYQSLSFPVLHVPVLPPSERVDFILNNINNS